LKRTYAYTEFMEEDDNRAGPVCHIKPDTRKTREKQNAAEAAVCRKGVKKQRGGKSAMNRRLCAFAMCAVLMLGAGGFPQAVRAEEGQSDPPGLYIMPPAVPRAVKIAALRMADYRNSIYGLTAVDAVGYTYDVIADDGDLDGPYLEIEDGYPDSKGEKVPDITAGQPFACYGGVASGRSYYAFAYVHDGVVGGFGFIGTRTDTNGAAHAWPDGSYSFVPWLLSSGAGWMNTLALNPKITKDNPLLLYQTEAGTAGVTLDGGYTYVVSVSSGYSAEEAAAEAKTLHQKRPKDGVAGEKVIRVNAAITEEETENPYLSFEEATDDENAALNKLLAEAGYSLGEFRFTRQVVHGEEICVTASAKYDGEDGAPYTVQVTVDKGVICAYALVETEDWSCRHYIAPGATVQEVAAWVKETLRLRGLKRAMTEKAAAFIGDDLALDAFPLTERMTTAWEVGKTWQNVADAYYIIREISLKNSRESCALYIFAGFGPNATEENLFIEVYAELGDRVLKAREGESLTALLKRLKAG